MTDPLGQSQVLPYLKGLAQHGYTFHLVSFEKHDRYLKHKSHIQAICDEAGIQWHPQDYATEGGLRRTWRQIRRMKRVVRYLHNKHAFDMAHCRSYIAAMSGLELKRKHGVKMLFDMRGFWADERVDGKLWDLTRPVYKLIYAFFKKKELEYFNESDYTVSLTNTGKEEILSWKGIRKGIAIEVIPCCVDLELFNPDNLDVVTREKLKNYHGITENEKIVGYIGSIGTWYMLPEMLAWFKEYRSLNADARFMFVTGEPAEIITTEAARQGIDPDNIIVTSCLHKDVPLHISLFDLSIFFIRPTYSKKASSPTKQGEIMAMGIPLVCNAGVGDTDSIVNEYNAGKVISAFTQETYRDALITPEDFDPERIKSGAKEYFALDQGVKRYLHVYQKIYGE